MTDEIILLNKIAQQLTRIADVLERIAPQELLNVEIGEPRISIKEPVAK